MTYHHDEHVFTRRGVLTGVVAYLIMALIIASPFL